ncbi:MAG: EamA family transporter [Chloroflexi bacterium]|nr:EamA family transporter [Chloroflexota bacterium]
MNSHTRAVISLVIAIIFLSTSGLLIKLSSWDAIALNGARSLIAAAVLWIYLRRPHFTWSRAQVGGAILYAVTIITFVQATRWTTAANAVFLQFTAPLWVALFGIWLLGERPQRIDWITMIVIGIGMLLFFGDELTPAGYWGNLLAIFSGMCMALMLIALRKQKAGSPTETVLLGNLIAAAIGLPFIILGDQPVNPRELSIILFMGIFQLGLPFIVVTLAVKQLFALEMMLIQTLEPILNPIWVFIFVGERPTPMALAGAALVTTAVTVRAIAAARRNGQQKPAVT